MHTHVFVYANDNSGEYNSKSCSMFMDRFSLCARTLLHSKTKAVLVPFIYECDNLSLKQYWTIEYVYLYLPIE